MVIRKGKLKSIGFKFNRLKFGVIGLKALKSGIIHLKQIESFKQAVFKNAKYSVKIWNRQLFSTIITKKAVGVRMGKGSGNISGTIFKYSYGNILLEFSSLKSRNLLTVIYSIKARLPVKTKVIVNSLLFIILV